MRVKYLSIMFALLTVSCNQTKLWKTATGDVAENVVAKIDYSDYVHIKPRDSLSAEELELFHTLEKVLYENVTVENNKFAFKLDKDSFLNMGIPEKYYDLLMKDIADNNRYLETEQSVKLNLDSLWQEIVKAYKEKPDF